MVKCDIAIVGGGPAGLTAAISAAQSGAQVVLFERNPTIGGQLIKQTHMFFGSEKQYASSRGFDIASLLLGKLSGYEDQIKLHTNATVLGLYEDGVLTAEVEGRYLKYKPKRVVLATGASEKIIPFPGNDLPGVYGAGAVQTLMNVYGIKPASRVLMVGAGNIGLIVSYQLLQAGVEVAGVVTADTITGYHVHASKIARMGVPIMAGYSVKRALGTETVEAAEIVQLNEKYEEIPGTEKMIEVDAICLSVGLSPLTDLIRQAGGQVKWVPELGGYVPKRDGDYRSSVPWIFLAGDTTGIEEASAAMVEGYLAGLMASKDMGLIHPDFEVLVKDYHQQLMELRSGPHGKRIHRGLEKIMEVRDV